MAPMFKFNFKNASALPGPWVCVAPQRETYSRGIWHGEDPLDFVVPLFMLQIVIFFFVSQFFYFLLKPLKQPKFISKMLAGIVLGHSLMGKGSFMNKVFPEKESLMISIASVFAWTYLIFLFSVKIDTTNMLKQAKATWRFGLFCTILPYTFIATVYGILSKFIPAMIIPHPPYLFSILAITNLTDIVYLMHELNMSTSELGQLVISAATLNQMMSWVTNRTASFFTTPTIYPILYGTIACIIFMLVMCFCVRPFVHWVIRTTPEGKPVSQTYIVLFLVAPMLAGFATDTLGWSIVPGITILGLIIPEGPPLGTTLVEKSELLINEVFLPFIYLRTGRHFEDMLMLFSWKYYAWFLVVVAGYIAIFLAAFLGSYWFKMKFAHVLLLALMLNIKGPMDLIIYIKIATMKMMDYGILSTIVIAHMAMTAIAIPLIKIFYNPEVRIEASRAVIKRSLSKAPVTIGELRILLCVHEEEDVHGIVTMLETINPNNLTPVYAYIVHVVKLVGRATPLLVAYKDKNKMRNNSGDRIFRAIKNFVKVSQRDIVLQPFTLIAPFKTMHEFICRLAQDKHVPLVIVPFPKSQDPNLTLDRRMFQTTMQEYAPCTVGILVHRVTFSQRIGDLSFCFFSYKILVLFLGGADDREALALVSRMSSHPQVTIVVKRFMLTEYLLEQTESELQLDNTAIQDIMSLGKTGGRIECHEIEAEDFDEMIREVQSTESGHDLIVVGRRQGISEKSLEAENTGQLTDYAELGFIGDMVASQDFCGGTSSVLVLQHYALDEEEINILS